MTQPFFSGRIYEPARRLYFFFQVVIIIPTDGHRQPDLFFSGRNYDPAETSELVEPPQPFPLTTRRLNLFCSSGSNYEPARRLYLFFLGHNYHSYRWPETTVPFFISGCNYEPAETSKLVEPPQTFPLMARRLNLFFSGHIYEPTRQLYLFFRL